MHNLPSLDALYFYLRQKEFNIDNEQQWTIHGPKTHHSLTHWISPLREKESNGNNEQQKTINISTTHHSSTHCFCSPHCFRLVSFCTLNTKREKLLTYRTHFNYYNRNSTSTTYLKYVTSNQFVLLEFEGTQFTFDGTTRRKKK